MPTQVGSPVKYYQKWAFVLIIEEVVVGGFMTAGPLKQMLSIVEQGEGGARTAVDKSGSKFKTEPLTATRGGSSNRELWDWWKNLKRGVQDKRNCILRAQDSEGNPIQNYPLESCIISEFTAGDWDEKADTENIIESIQLTYIDFDRKDV